jgi:hypothetical protein
VHRGREGVAVRRLTQEEARLTAMLCSGSALSEAMPERDSAVFVALLADHLAQGRFAGFATGELDNERVGKG